MFIKNKFIFLLIIVCLTAQNKLIAMETIEGREFFIESDLESLRLEFCNLAKVVYVFNLVEKCNEAKADYERNEVCEQYSLTHPEVLASDSKSFGLLFEILRSPVPKRKVYNYDNAEVLDKEFEKKINIFQNKPDLTNQDILSFGENVLGTIIKIKEKILPAGPVFTSVILKHSVLDVKLNTILVCNDNDEERVEIPVMDILRSYLGQNIAEILNISPDQDLSIMDRLLILMVIREYIDNILVQIVRQESYFFDLEARIPKIRRKLEEGLGIDCGTPASASIARSEQDILNLEEDE